MPKGEYLMCVGCGNTKKGTYIFKCNHCGVMFCSACSSGLLLAVCPNCKKYGGAKLGEIK